MSVVDKIGVPALLEQTAEECCELAHACLKMARKLRDENPTPRQIEDIRDDLVEEIADAHLCIGMITNYTDILTNNELFDIENAKRHRWEKRLNAHMDFEKEEMELDDVVYSD